MAKPVDTIRGAGDSKSESGDDWKVALRQEIEREFQPLIEEARVRRQQLLGKEPDEAERKRIEEDFEAEMKSFRRLAEERFREEETRKKGKAGRTFSTSSVSAQQAIFDQIQRRRRTSDAIGRSDTVDLGDNEEASVVPDGAPGDVDTPGPSRIPDQDHKHRTQLVEEPSSISPPRSSRAPLDSIHVPPNRQPTYRSDDPNDVDGDWNSPIAWTSDYAPVSRKHSTTSLSSMRRRHDSSRGSIPAEYLPSPSRAVNFPVPPSPAGPVRRSSNASSTASASARSGIAISAPRATAPVPVPHTPTPPPVSSYGIQPFPDFRQRDSYDDANPRGRADARESYNAYTEPPSLAARVRKQPSVTDMPARRIDTTRNLPVAYPASSPISPELPRTPDSLRQGSSYTSSSMRRPESAERGIPIPSSSRSHLPAQNSPEVQKASPGSYTSRFHQHRGSFTSEDAAQFAISSPRTFNMRRQNSSGSRRSHRSIGPQSPREHYNGEVYPRHALESYREQSATDTESDNDMNFDVEALHWREEEANMKKRQAEALKKQQDELERAIEGARRQEEEARMKEEEARLLGQEARRETEEARRRQEEARIAGEEARRKEEELRKKEEDLQRREDDLRRREEFAKKENELQQREWELQRREAQAIIRLKELEEAAKAAQAERAAEARREEEARKATEEAEKAEAEAKRIADEEAKRAAEEDAKRIAEEARRVAEESARQIAEEAMRMVEETKKLALAEETKRRERMAELAEEERRLEEERQRLARQKEEDRERRRQEDAKRRAAAQREAERMDALKREEERIAALRREAEAEKKEQERREEERREDEVRREAEERRKEEERKEAEAADRRRLAQEAERRRAAAAVEKEKQRIAREEEERHRKAEEEAERRRLEDERRRFEEDEAQRRADEERTLENIKRQAAARDARARAEKAQAEEEERKKIAREEDDHRLAQQAQLEEDRRWAAMLEEKEKAEFKRKEGVQRAKVLAEQEAIRRGTPKVEDGNGRPPISSASQAAATASSPHSASSPWNIPGHRQGSTASTSSNTSNASDRTSATSSSWESHLSNLSGSTHASNTSFTSQSSASSRMSSTTPTSSQIPKSPATPLSSQPPRSPATPTTPSGSSTSKPAWRKANKTAPSSATSSATSPQADFEEDESRRWQERQEEQRRRQYEQYQRQQAEAQRARLYSESKSMSRDAIQRIWANHEQQWAELSSSEVLSWYMFPWPTLKIPKSPEELTSSSISAYFTSPNAPADRPLKDRLKDHIRRWHPDRFNSRYLSKVVDNERELVQAGAAAVIQTLNELFAGQ